MHDQEEAQPGGDDGDQRPGDQAGAALRAGRLSGSPAGEEEKGDDGAKPGKGGGEREIDGPSPQWAETPCSVFSQR